MVFLCDKNNKRWDSSEIKMGHIIGDGSGTFSVKYQILRWEDPDFEVNC